MTIDPAKLQQIEDEQRRQQEQQQANNFDVGGAIDAGSLAVDALPTVADVAGRVATVTYERVAYPTGYRSSSDDVMGGARRESYATGDMGAAGAPPAAVDADIAAQATAVTSEAVDAASTGTDAASAGADIGSTIADAASSVAEGAVEVVGNILGGLFEGL